MVTWHVFPGDHENPQWMEFVPTLNPTPWDDTTGGLWEVAAMTTGHLLPITQHWAQMRPLLICWENKHFVARALQGCRAM